MELLKERLLKGETVSYRSCSGWSLWPRVNSGDMVTYRPMTSAEEVHVDMIVFCEVQPSNRFFGHLVKEKFMRHGQWHFTISNMKGLENGYCRIEHIYGRLVDVES